MYGNQFNSYNQANVGTADRGKLIIMIYDHCIKWCNFAKVAIQSGSIENRTKGIFKAQDGITELICSLDFDKGGEIAKNLHSLYDFYNRHLSEANLENSEQNLNEVIQMLEMLREAWVQAIGNVRKTSELNMQLNSQSNVSLVG